MVSPLEGSLATAIHRGMRSLFMDATLVRDVPTSTSPDIDASFDPPAFVTVQHVCKAVRDNYTASEIDGSNILRGDAKILILAQSIAVLPARGDRVIVDGGTFRLIDVLRDPANALYTCHGRQ